MPKLTKLVASAFTVPTEEPESDGTLEWDSTTLVLVEASDGRHRGLGYSYTTPAAVDLIQESLGPAVLGVEVSDIPAAWENMVRVTRNLGRPGVVSAAIAAVDNALWDLKARILDSPLCRLLGMARSSVPVYASGGFTSYDKSRLRDQLSTWASRGFSRVKMKIGREPEADAARVASAREVIGDSVELFVDANGAFERKQAARMVVLLEDLGVTWFEEPVSSDDLAGLHSIREVAKGMDVTAGEYGYDLFYFRDMLDSGAVDVLQVDATRCAGITTLLRSAALCRAAGVPLSTHTAPAQHLHAACALAEVVHMEYFHDHVRLESMLFDGVVEPKAGMLRPDLTRPGIGIEFKEETASQYRVR